MSLDSFRKGYVQGIGQNHIQQESAQILSVPGKLLKERLDAPVRRVGLDLRFDRHGAFGEVGRSRSTAARTILAILHS